MYSIEQKDSQLLETTANIRYHIHFNRAAQHLLRVEMEIDTSDDSLTIGLPVWTPGSYKVREFSSNQADIQVKNSKGQPLPFRRLSKNQLQIETLNSSVVRVEYSYFAFERTVRTSHINRFHAFINPSNCLMFVTGREKEIHHVFLHHDRTFWSNYSTALSPVKTHFQHGEPVQLGALNYDILIDSPIEIGNHSIQKFVCENATHEVAIVGQGNFNAKWICDKIKTIVSTEAKFWGGVPYDRYVFIIQLYPNIRGGLEHSRSSVNAWDSNLAGDSAKIVDFLSLICHEFFHTWNVKRIRPRELGHFDYNQENYTQMLWLAEGATSYFDDLLTYRCGFYTQEEYLGILNKNHLSKLARVQGRFSMSVKDSSFLAWIKLYLPTGDSNNRFPSYYLKGGILFLLLDLFVIAKSGGKKRLDDVMLALWKRYEENPSIGISEDEFLTIAEKTTQVKIRNIFLNWLNGTEELPYNQIFEPFGLEWRHDVRTKSKHFGENLALMSSPQKLFTGLSVKIDGEKVIVTQVEENSPAITAGIGIDDEILFVNGVRVASQNFETTIALGGLHTQKLVVSCDGTLYETMILPEKFHDFELAIVDNQTDKQRKYLNFWLMK